MKLTSKVKVDPAALFDREVAIGARAVKTVMTRATSSSTGALREQVVSAGLGQRVANAWRGETYPKGRDSLGAATYVWSKAPEIHAAFDQGSLIKRAGGLWLAIPTKDTPRSRGARGATRLASPFEVEDQFNQDLILLPSKHPGVAYLAMRVVQAKSKKGWRKGTDRRLAQGRQVKVVVMFILVRQVKLPKKLDIDRAIEQASAAIATDIALTWAQG